MGDVDLRLLDDHYNGELVDSHALTDLCQRVSSDTSHPPLANVSSLMLGRFLSFCRLVFVGFLRMEGLRCRCYRCNLF